MPETIPRVTKCAQGGWQWGLVTSECWDGMVTKAGQWQHG